MGSGTPSEHQAAQDRTFFPALMARTDAINGYLTRLERDHDRIEELTDHRSRCSRPWKEPPPAGVWDIPHHRACRLSGELERVTEEHLDLEAQVELPELARHITSAEHERLSQRATQYEALSQLAFSIPWVMGHSNDDERDTLLRDAPMSFTLLWRATRRHYERIARTALHPDARRRAYPGEWSDGAAPTFN